MMDELLRDTFARHEVLVPVAPPGLPAAIITGARRRRARRRWAWTSLFTAVIVAVALLALPGPVRPHGADPQVAASAGPLHLLLVGIDRTGAGQPAQVRADAMVLVHVDRGGGAAYAVIVPPDLRLDLPGLGRQRADGVYLVGGYRLAADAMTRLTGVPLDGGAVVDIAAMESITEAAGGVDMCVERRVQSRHLAYDGLGELGEPDRGRQPVVYEPGCRHYDARLAVDYLRASIGAGDERAVRAYVTALAAAAADPARLPALLSAAGRGLELHLGAGSLSGLAHALRGIDARRVQVVRLPAGSPDGDGLYAALRAGEVGPWLAAHPQYAV